MRAVLGFEPPGPFDSVALDGRSSRTRYGRVEALDAAYGLVGDAAGTPFEERGFPTALPAGRRAAARLVPVRLRRAAGTARRAPLHRAAAGAAAATTEGRSPEERRAIAERVVELQKPAHTTFDVKFFWAAFRVGEARLGEDTLLDLGSRDPRLLQPVVLGREHAGESYLGGEPAPAAGRRRPQPLEPMTSARQEMP